MKKLTKAIKSLYQSFPQLSLFEDKEPSCKVCNDTKQMEVLVMGVDTEWVECSHCSNKK